MTVRELKTQLNTLDDDTPLAVYTPDGQSDITRAEKEGGYFTFWADNS